MTAQRNPSRAPSDEQAPAAPPSEERRSEASSAPSYGIVRVVKASRRLGAYHKLVMADVAYSSQKDGYSTMGADLLAERNGIGVRYVKEIRSELRKMGLLWSEPGGQGRSARWGIDLPLPLVIPDAKAPQAEITASAQRLDELIDAGGLRPRRPNEASRVEPPVDEQLSVTLLAVERPVVSSSPPGGPQATGTRGPQATPLVVPRPPVPVVCGSPTGGLETTLRLTPAPPSSEPKTETKEEEPDGIARPPLDAARSPPAEWATTKAEVRRHVRSPPA